MQEEEADKVLVILLSHALPDPSINELLPNTVMIKFRYTHLAYTTMFWSGRLHNITGCAFIIFFVKDSIVGSFILFYVAICGLFLYLSWGDWASFVVNEEADACHHIGGNNVSISYHIIRHVLENAQKCISCESITQISVTLQLRLDNKTIEQEDGSFTSNNVWRGLTHSELFLQILF